MGHGRRPIALRKLRNYEPPLRDAEPRPSASEPRDRDRARRRRRPGRRRRTREARLAQVQRRRRPDRQAIRERASSGLDDRKVRAGPRTRTAGRRVTDWTIQVPHRDRDESLATVAGHARRLPGDDAAVTREIVLRAELAGHATAGDLI